MNRKAFFDAIRKAPFRQSLSPEQVAGTEAKLDAFEEAGWPLEWAAYGLATSFHETGATMQPEREIGRGRGKRYGLPAGPHRQVYYGRGDVQLTWLANYEKAGKALGIDLVKYPDLALEPAVSARIMIRGMAEGWFTGKRNSHYLTPGKPDYVGARRIINGTDRAQLIAGYARHFERALRLAGYDGKPDTIAAKPPIYDERLTPPKLDKPVVAQAPVSATNPAPVTNPPPQPRKGLFSWLKGLIR